MSAATAERLLQELGPEALEAVKVCVEECRRLGDETAERFWRDVEAQLGSATHGEADGRAPPRGLAANDERCRRRRWAFMQKVELSRRRAMNAERLAGGSEQHREDMLDIALQWFELARQYEWLAEGEGLAEASPPSPRSQGLGLRRRFA